MKRTLPGAQEKTVVCPQGDPEAKRSLSCYNVIEEIENDGETFSLVEVEIKTGLTHQIRVHMKYLKHSILGDHVYGKPS